MSPAGACSPTNSTVETVRANGAARRQDGDGEEGLPCHDTIGLACLLPCRAWLIITCSIVILFSLDAQTTAAAWRAPALRLRLPLARPRPVEPSALLRTLQRPSLRGCASSRLAAGLHRGWACRHDSGVGGMWAGTTCKG
jgi:hypothetical protein